MAPAVPETLCLMLNVEVIRFGVWKFARFSILRISAQNGSIRKAGRPAWLTEVAFQL